MLSEFAVSSGCCKHLIMLLKYMSSGAISMFLPDILILITIVSLLAAQSYMTALYAHPSFVHWSQWKKEKLIGSGSFGQVYLASNRYSMIPSVFRP